MLRFLIKQAELYCRASALIYRPVLESFGLPLIEARHAALPVLSGEPDYICDVLDPEECLLRRSSNKNAPVSIGRSAWCYLNIEERLLLVMEANTCFGLLLEWTG